MTPLDTLAPDQRAVLELVLRQGRSYGELSELLGIPERDVRARADAGLRARFRGALDRLGIPRRQHGFFTRKHRGLAGLKIGQRIDVPPASAKRTRGASVGTASPLAWKSVETGLRS